MYRKKHAEHKDRLSYAIKQTTSFTEPTPMNLTNHHYMMTCYAEFHPNRLTNTE